MLNHGDIIKQEDELYNGHGWEIVPASWVGTAVDLETLYPPNRHYVFIRRLQQRLCDGAPRPKDVYSRSSSGSPRTSV